MIAREGGSGRVFFLYDQLSARATITDGQGGIQGRQSHLPFGEELNATGTTDKHQFTSYERDSETGTDYAVNRQYSQGVGRFNQVDPVVGMGPQSLNRYAYVQNDPINSTDPLGLVQICHYRDARHERYQVVGCMPVPTNPGPLRRPGDEGSGGQRKSCEERLEDLYKKYNQASPKISDAFNAIKNAATRNFGGQVATIYNTFFEEFGDINDDIFDKVINDPNILTPNNPLFPPGVERSIGNLFNKLGGDIRKLFNDQKVPIPTGGVSEAQKELKELSADAENLRNDCLQTLSSTDQRLLKLLYGNIKLYNLTYGSFFNGINGIANPQ